jgi:hypothetical protein
MKKIVSYCLFGNNPRYTVNAFVNAELCKTFYSDWICRMYHDSSVPNHILTKLAQQNVELIYADGRNHYRRMWRFYAYDDADIFISRDIDSYITEREKSAVDEWLNSSASLHIMRDHPHHKNKIQAGMFGIKKTNKLNNLKQKCLEYSNKSTNHLSMDEKFLDNIYPLFLNDMIVHDDNNFHKDANTIWKVKVQKTDEHGQFVGRPQYPPSININIFKQYEGVI